MAEKQRVTNHQSRTGDKGNVIKATHNEHDFEAEHINPELTSDNRRWLFHDVGVEDGEHFQDRYEQAVYEEYFSDYLNSRNEKAIKGRHKDRVQTMEQFRVNPKACPEETLFYIGNRDNLVDPDVLAAVYESYVQWHNETFPNVMLLNAYLHLDEASPHIHERKVWTAHDGDMLIINQEKALAEMGIERPDPDKKVSRYNNAKMTYTAMCREKLIELAREHGLEIEDKPKEASKSGKKLLQVQVRDLERKLAELEAIVSDSSQEIQELKATIAEKERRIAEYEQALTAAEADTKETKTVKGVFGKEKEVPKTADELEHDKAIIGAKLVLQREQAVTERERSVDTDKQLLANHIRNAVAYERQEADERQRRAVARARREEQVRAEQERKQLQTERDNAVNARTTLQKQLDEERSRSDEVTDLAISLDYLVDDILQRYELPEEYRDMEQQYWEQLQKAVPTLQQDNEEHKQSRDYPTLD
ncbi:MAG: plasmid recombination protein [Ruminococcus sp.]|nr:plasmid recombination protein [Ruminococcus sp.]